MPGWDRQGLERLVRYCARPPLSQERLGRLNQDTLVYHLRKPTADGRTELILTPLELLDHLAQLVTPPRVHKHRYCGVLAPNAKLRRAVIESAGPAGATLQLLQEASEKMGLEEVDLPDDRPTSRLGRAAARCWALLLTRIYECLPLRCPHCGTPMRIIAFVLDPPTIERILRHIDQPHEPPAVAAGAVAAAGPRSTLTRTLARASGPIWTKRPEPGTIPGTEPITKHGRTGIAALQSGRRTRCVGAGAGSGSGARDSARAFDVEGSVW